MVTAMTIDRYSIRQIAAAMALVMAIASLPSIGIIVFSDRSGPSISLDVCHPLPSLDVSTGTVLIARPARPEFSERIFPAETFAQLVPILKSKFAESPDPPPPKLFS
jgi:hypothetical protein